MVLRGNTRTRFSVLAEHDHNTLARVLDMFAVRDVRPNNLSARRTQDGMHWIELDCSDLDDHAAAVLLSKIRQIITVKTARIETLVLRLEKLAA